MADVIFGKYETNGIVDLDKIKLIVIYHYIKKDPINYM